jgi:hypothetical protein
MTHGRPRRGWRYQGLALALTGLILGLAPVVGDAPSGAAMASPDSAGPSAETSAAATANADLTLGQWKQRYEHDIGILADDLLVVVDDGKRAQKHDTAAKVKTTLQDCRQWGKDATIAPTAAPPIPMAAAERAWTSMMRASALAAAQCVAALQKRSLTAARNFRKQLAIAEKDEATLVRLLSG